MALFLAKNDRDLLVFHLFKALKYIPRLIIALTLILTGLIIQIQMYEVFPGLLVVLSGNLLLLVKGYHNKINLGKFHHDARWEKADSSRIEMIEKMDLKMKKWDRSAIDVTSGWGCFTFIILSAIIFIYLVSGLDSWLHKSSLIIGMNLLVLWIPYWVTGAKKILQKPALIQKITIIKRLVYTYKQYLSVHKLEYYLLLTGNDKVKKYIPDDVKFRVALQNQTADFLGLYGQIAINNVSGKKYPYFYVVLVANKGFNIEAKTRSYKAPNPIIKEYTQQKDVEVLVLRQYTTRTSGYHTKDKTIDLIFSEGLRLALQINNTDKK